MKILRFIEKAERILVLSVHLFRIVVMELLAIAAIMFILCDYIDGLLIPFVIATLIMLVLTALTVYIEHLKNKEAEETD